MIRNKRLQELDLSLNSLIVFRRILVDPVIVPLRPLLDTEITDPIIQLRQYAEFTSRLFPKNMNLTEYLLKLVLEDDNFFMRMIARGEEPDDILQACVCNELSVIQRLATLKPVELMKEISYYGPLPEWKTSKVDFIEVYFSRIAEIEKHGYGLFTRSSMFTVSGEDIIPVQHPDPVRLHDLFGSDAPRQMLIENTRALLNGKHAQHALICGGSGTGKSAAVKAIANEFAPEGLRLIQITQAQLSMLPDILDRIYDNPLRFILFLDDLAPDADDAGFRTLHTILGGSVYAMPKNAIFYAICNGNADAEPVQRPTALSERFGLHVQFDPPTKEEYLGIVLEMADRADIPMDSDTICAQAEQFAKLCGGYSPRTAQQFIYSIS